MPYLRADLEAGLAELGLPATVTVPGEHPVVTTAVWLSPVSVETLGVLVATDRPQRALALPLADLPLAPETDPAASLRGTLIQVAEAAGGPIRTWIVEALMERRAHLVRVLVLPAESP
jgi:hypothetical protein